MALIFLAMLLTFVSGRQITFVNFLILSSCSTLFCRWRWIDCGNENLLWNNLFITIVSIRSITYVKIKQNVSIYPTEKLVINILWKCSQLTAFHLYIKTEIFCITEGIGRGDLYWHSLKWDSTMNFYGIFSVFKRSIQQICNLWWSFKF